MIVEKSLVRGTQERDAYDRLLMPIRLSLLTVCKVEYSINAQGRLRSSAH
jgi:hypothetical protein